MYTQTERGEGVVGYNLMNLTPFEMSQLCQMKTRVISVLNSHHPKYKGKKIYLSDEDLLMIASIFRTIACDFSEFTSSFDTARQDLLDEQKVIFAEDKE